MFRAHCIVLFTCEPSDHGVKRPWHLVLFVACAMEDTLRITCPGISRLTRGENEGTQYVRFNVQAVLAMYNLTLR